MAPNRKRKTSPAVGEDEASAKRRFVESESAQPAVEADTADNEASVIPTPAEATPQISESASPPSATNNAAADRLARFKALKARQAAGTKANAKEVARESDRAKIDPELVKKLDRKNAIASHKLLKDDTEASGSDFERKRAWDWTIDESEKWDERLQGKRENKESVAFSDYSAEAQKVYQRQMRDFKPDLEGYERDKMDAIQRAARDGGLEIVETETGELIAVDRDGSFLSAGDQADFSGKPSKEALDRLVNDIKKAEEMRLAKRRQRNKEQNNEDGDVTYINQKNKQFNEKLKRFYDKYTADIRENFERGTAI
jgi:pre-mRNA-splicing factor SYF2